MVQRLIGVSLLVVFLVPALAIAESTSRLPTIRHHQLALELLPDSHQLVATDQLTIAGGSPEQVLAFSLAPTLLLERLEDVTLCQDPCASAVPVAFERAGSSGQSEAQRITLKQPPADPADGSVRLRFSYRGVIDDPPRDPRHLRFVTPSETSGHIGPEGVYLSSESKWYPDLSGSLASYQLDVAAPVGWVSVS